MQRRKVYVVGGDGGVCNMFTRQGWDVIDNIQEADLVQFTGGSDISPELYRHTKHPTTHPNPQRDAREVLVFQLARAQKKPMAGICRGAQLLNVLCGGTMWQDVNNHHGSHKVVDRVTGEEFMVTSVHHQMMIRGKGSKLIATAKESTKREIHVNGGLVINNSSAMLDTEILHYPADNVFCFQPHPEFGKQELIDRYFEYLDEYLLPRQPNKEME